MPRAVDAKRKVYPIVKEVARVSRKTYGTRRIVEELKENGRSCGRGKARRLMKLAGVSVFRRKKFRVTTDSRHKLPVSSNLLARNFQSQHPIGSGYLISLSLDIRGLVVSCSCFGFVSEEARRDVVDYIEMFYNSKRWHSYLGYLSPMAFEERWSFKEST